MMNSLTIQSVVAYNIILYLISWKKELLPLQATSSDDAEECFSRMLGNFFGRLNTGASAAKP